MKKINLVLLFLVLSWNSFAQQKFTISGNIKDKQSGEELIGASVMVKDLVNVGAVANAYGFYSITLPSGQYTLKVSFVGYQDILQTIILTNQNTRIDFNLDSGKELEEVVVKSVKKDNNLSKTTMGSERLDIGEIAKVPVLFGEKDVLKTLQLLPGVKAAGEGNSGFYVRGGGSDQNLILLDEAPVYNASHLLGFFSTFNSDAIKDANIIKGNSPANYGGRLSSVLDVKMKEGNDKQTSVSGGIGFISSRINIEGPIQKEKSSFLITARRTYADVFLKATDEFKDNSLYFYDLNAKANYRFNDKNRIYLSGYFGKDVLGFGNTFGTNWGNQTGTLRWNSIINPKVFSNTSIIYSKYNYEIDINANGNNISIDSEIKDWNIKQEFQFFTSPNSTWNIGLNSIYHTITPSNFISESDKKDRKKSKFGWENALYANNTYKLNSKLTMDFGLRASSWSIIGGKDAYNTYLNGTKTGSKTLKEGEIGKTYLNLEPRASLNFRVNDQSSLKASYARNTQNLHLLSNSTSSNPTDQWIGTSYNIKPEISDQFSVGYFKNFNENNYEFSIESYFKDMQNQVDYKDAADINTALDVESELLFGKGRAYGIEFLLKKKTGKFTGWAGYTWSRTQRQIEGINNNDWYYAKQDRTHDISLVGIYQFNKKWSVSGVFVYNTGNAVTFPSGKYIVDGTTTFLYTERNGYRMPAYHRLDLSATYEKPKKGRFQSSWNFGLYNTYGRPNAYTITFRDNEKDPTKTEAVRTSLFKWVPSITYNFKF